MKRIVKLIFGLRRPNLGSVSERPKVRTVLPNTVLNLQQHRAHLVLLLKKDFCQFNNFSSKNLNLVERNGVLDCLTLNELN